MKHAIVAVEDKRFYEHRGIDLRGMARAVWADVSHRGTVQGGSTITQQFVKNAYLTSQKSIARKLAEAALAWQLEQRWSKDRILTAYLNTVYFGNGAYGVEQASQHLLPPQRRGRMKPGRGGAPRRHPRGPEPLGPGRAPAGGARRGATSCCGLLYAAGLPDARASTTNSLDYPMPKPEERARCRRRRASRRRTSRTTSRTSSSTSYGPTRSVRRRPEGDDDARRRPAADRARRDRVGAAAERHGPTAALVALDAHTGAVLAMVGGANYHKNQFNLATQGERQPGSSFKPFVLATALQGEHRAVDACSTREPVTINADGRLWKVNNYEGEYLGPINLTQAIAYSDNSVFSQLTAIVGPAQRRDDGARSSGSRRRSTATSRSGSAPSRRRRSRWRAPTRRFADGGNRIDGSIFGNQPRAIDDDRGRAATRAGQRRRRASRCSTADAGGDVNQLLQGVVQLRHRQGGGSCPAAQVAGKTGTTENYGDAWFVGYTPQFVAAVWVGYPDKLVPMTDRVPRPPGRRRHVPGADLEGVHDEGARVPEAAAGDVPAAPTTATRRRSRSSTAAACSSATTASARTRCSSQFFGGERPDASVARPASRTRSRSRTSSASRSPTREGAARRASR